MSDLTIYEKDNLIELETIESKLYPNRNGMGVIKRLKFLFTGNLEFNVGAVYVRLKNKKLHFLSGILSEYRKLEERIEKLEKENKELKEEKQELMDELAGVDL